MKKLRWSFKTKPRNGKVSHFIIENHGESGFLAQLTRCPAIPDPNNLHSDDVVMDLFQTLEEACEALNYPYEIAGLPKLK